ncbi:MAG: protein-L-isoaspartate(D-aspartate) O-methyltransferase [Peptococcaceae bacterium]|nr:protein-L-isoaspartate(D-aspartate) O-methyltransferase [Peptococcaceae bacterium]
MDNWREQAVALVERSIAPQGIANKNILEAMKAIPRHLFIPPELRAYSYEDIPLPIGEEQTISQPFIVAKMTDLLALEQGDKVLEIGTGSGYQSALLAEMGMKVTTIERIELLALKSREVFRQLSYNNIVSIIGDGREGYSDNAPYQGIIVTAEASKIEDAWLDQLVGRGKLVLPLSTGNGLCRLCVRQKKADENAGYIDTWYDYCRFVPILPGVKK